jgi:hypothetical protein
MESHDLLHEFPGHREKILSLQKGSNRFRKLQENTTQQTAIFIALKRVLKQPQMNT